MNFAWGKNFFGGNDFLKIKNRYGFFHLKLMTEFFKRKNGIFYGRKNYKNMYLFFLFFF